MLFKKVQAIRLCMFYPLSLFVILKGKTGKPLINDGRKFKGFQSPLKTYNKTCSAEDQFIYVL